MLAPLHEGQYNLPAAADGFVSGSVDFTVPLASDRSEVVLVLQPLEE